MEQDKLKVGIACGVFDIFHIGHVLMLEECKSHCDYLVVAVNEALNIDNRINPLKQPPVFSLMDRIKVLKSCRYVDEVTTYNSESQLMEIFDSDRFKIRFLGDDYRDKPITEGKVKIPIHFINRSHGWSTTRLKKIIHEGF